MCIRDMLGLLGDDTDKWPTEFLTAGVWTIFPHVSFAGSEGGGRAVRSSQLCPGETPGSSYKNVRTQCHAVQNHLCVCFTVTLNSEE